MARTSSAPDAALSAASSSDTGRRHTIGLVIISLRPEQWLKNLLLFAGLIFGGRLLEIHAVLSAAAAFAIFCALSGAVYLFNDVRDQDADRRHPLKQERPIAAGALLPRTALSVAAALSATAVAAAFWISVPLGTVAAGYSLLLLLYSVGLKHIVIIDVLTIAGGFVLRAIAGALAVDVPIGTWLLTCTTLLALFLALSKRRHELILLGEGAVDHRRILDEYSPYLLDQMISVVTASTLIAYATFAISADTALRLGTEHLGLTIPFVLYGIFRYLYLVHQKRGGGSPAGMLATDRPLLACVVLWVGTVVMLMYLPLGKWSMPAVSDTPSTLSPPAPSRTARVAVVRTRPETVVEDYGLVMDLAGYREVLPRDRDTIIKLNLSWTKYFPACSSQPWQVDGVATKMIGDGYERQKLIPVENKTVVTNPREGCRNNRWEPVLTRHGLTFTPLTDVDWQVYSFKNPLLKLNDIFPEGIQIPSMYVGKQILHLPTVKTHGHAVMTGSVKNSFGGLLREVRHYAHKYMHEVLVDLLYMQRELHPAVFTVMDGTIAGDGAGPRTMIPRVKNLLLAASDSVAIDSIAAKLMGFDPLSIPFLRMAHERGLGIADPRDIELVGDDVSHENFGFQTQRSLVIWGDQMIRKGFLRPFERLLLHSPLMVWAPIASNVYHDAFWYPTIGRSRIRSFMRTEWGQLFRKY